MALERPKFKLNRIQRKAYVRLLQALVRGQYTTGEAAESSLEERIDAANNLIEFGNKEEVMATFSNILSSPNESPAFKKHVMTLMNDGYRAGMADKEDDEGEE